MAAPIANFTYTPTGLSINFMDRSSGVPASWAWDFGDSNSSTSKNPTHLYTIPGVFLVSLTVTNTDGSSNKAYNIVVNTTAVLSSTIYDLVQSYITGTTVPPLDGQKFTEYKDYWQLYIAQRLDPEVVDPNIFNEFSYPPLANVLISKLIVYEMAWASLGGNLIRSGQSGTTKGAPVKRIETGPSSAEWYNPADSLNAMFKSSGNSGNAYDVFLEGICILSNSLQIPIPSICDEIVVHGLFTVVKTTAGCGCSPTIPPVISKGGWPWTIY